MKFSEYAKKHESDPFIGAGDYYDDLSDNSKAIIDRAVEGFVKHRMFPDFLDWVGVNFIKERGKWVYQVEDSRLGNVGMSFTNQELIEKFLIENKTIAVPSPPSSNKIN